MMGIGFYVISAVSMVIFIGLSWFVTSLLHLSPTVNTLVMMMAMGMMFAIFGLVFSWRQRRQTRKEQAGAQGQAAIATADKEVEVYIRDAQTRLAQSALGKEAKLTQLPAFFLIGEAGAAKTSIFVHSGVEPDLLSGQVYQDNVITSTQAVNLWLAQKSIFVEGGGKLLADSQRWSTLIKHLSPKWNLFQRRAQPPRAAIICVDCESFLRPNADDALTVTARNLRTRAGEISHAFGIRLPIYVLFSKLDRLAYFTDFVGNLTADEVTQVLGVTLPLRSDREQGGVYAEEESRRLAAAFDGLFYSLAGKRLPFLARENDAGKLPAVYEFPREFRKLRNAMVRFLVELGRPSQLRANPFLRGFYFSGVRPIVVNESSPLARSAQAQAPRSPATRFFATTSLPGLENPLPQPAESVKARRVPQWLFLGHLFSDVILLDRAALGASGQSIRTVLSRRILAASAAALFLLWSVGLTVSFFRNRALESRVSDAVRGIGPAEAGGASENLPSLDALQRLDTLRQSVELLSSYERQGPPWSLRWGLYTGHEVYPPTRRLYFSRFRQLLFGSTQLALLDWLKKLPTKPGPNDEYKPSYDTLKGYLITTSHHEKSTREFLSPLLMDRWAAGRQLDPERAALARRQFDFYSDELFIANPFSSDNDTEAVEHARYYLSQFNAIESIYQFIIADASMKNPPVNFNKQFPGSSDYVVNNKDVAGAFTVNGWKAVQEAISHVRQYFGGEAWVLGGRNYGSLDPVQLQPQLRERYHKDFIANWRTYLANSEVVKYRSLPDAAAKLKQLSSNESYLLKLFCLASVNVAAAGDSPSTAPYQPIQWVTPPTCMDHYVSEHNSSYLSALVALQTSIDQVARAGPNVKDEMVTQTQTDATNGYRVTRQIAQNFRIDPEGNVHGMVQKLMEDPIRQIEALLERLGPSQINAQGRSFCNDFLALMKKYPFDTGSKRDATLDDIGDIFRNPDGKLSAFYENTLKNYIEVRGGEYVRKSDSRVQITEPFLRFFNRATSFGNALYKAGAKDPSLSYSMRALPAEGVKSVTLTLDGQVLKGGSNGSQPQNFIWPGKSAQGAQLSGSLGGPEFGFIAYDGLWAAFRFFGDADRFQASGSTYTLQWVPRQGQSGQPIRLDNGRALALPFQLDLKGAPPVFQKGYLSGFTCVSEVAR
jgi:type VI secretion system protein ImpL